MPRPPAKFNAKPFAYHEEVDLRIDTLSPLGQGVGRIDGWVVFVPFSLPGELVRARIYRNAANYSEADLCGVIEPSAHRTEPSCPLFGECGGCQYQNLDYPTQLDWKRRQVAELLARLAGIDHDPLPVIPSPRTYGYRSKLTPHFKKPRGGGLGDIGFLRTGRRFELIDVPQCPIASPAINEALPGLRSDVLDRASDFGQGATLLLRESEGEKILTDPRATCEQAVGDVRFQFPAGEFFQNNPSILPAFTGHVAAEASGAGARFLVDAYCGAGLFCLTAAERFEQAAGVEISEASIRWAARNAELNGLSNCRFVQGRAEAIFAEISFPPAETSVIIDPPRKGCDPEFLEQLLAFRPSRVVYVSCNPATQMRDLNRLCGDRKAAGAYTLAKVQPFDLFPQTRHLECVATLDLTVES
ncbi:MAG: class I SAM-dependent RNA methyltransferase [Verrucomicrobiales bacterium]